MLIATHAHEACETSSYQNLVCEYAKFPFTELIKWNIPSPAKLMLCWLNITREETSQSLNYMFAKSKVI